MLGFKNISEAKSKVEAAQQVYKGRSNRLLNACEALNDVRFKRGSNVVGKFEDFINSMKNTPEDYSRAARFYRVRQHEQIALGEERLKEIDNALKDAAIKGGATAGVGAAAGAATAFGAPSAAMAVATTFGTASTGTAISSLSGAAASKAALAWLGGGALSAGGGGTAAGSALLALSGPVGWALCGTAVVAGAGWAYWKNSETLEKTIKLYEDVQKASDATLLSLGEVEALTRVTKDHVSKLETLVDQLLGYNITDFRLMTADQAKKATVCHNNVLSMARLIKMAPGEILDVDLPSMTAAELAYIAKSASICRDFILVGHPDYDLANLEVVNGRLVKMLPAFEGMAGIEAASNTITGKLVGAAVSVGEAASVVAETATSLKDAGALAAKSLKAKIFN
ncbi:hypothetical protein ACLS0R_15915 [Comamonas jiangduensis]|uniref:hypothetical protein n=1 Tax=Comamonas jiangduensis TaxID=1194168 RepID=UPI003BF802EF